MFAYLKHYYFIKHKDVSLLALEAWREYIKGKPRIYNMDICHNFQKGFINTYRHNYAKAQLALNKAL